MIENIIEEYSKSAAVNDNKGEELQINEVKIAKEQLDNLRRG